MSNKVLLETNIFESDTKFGKPLEDDDLLYMQAYLFNMSARISPPFFERKLKKGLAETIEEEIEELYSETFELDAYIKSLLNTNAVLLNNYEEKTREIYEKRLRLSEKFQILKEELQQIRKDLNEMEMMKDKLANRNDTLSEQIKKMELMYHKTSEQYDNLNEEILTLNDYQDKVYQLKEEMSFTADLINNLKYEYNEYKVLTNVAKQKHLKKEQKKIILKNKLIKYEEKLRNLLDKEKNEANILEHMTHHLDFLRKTFKNLQEVNQRKENEKRSLALILENHHNLPRNSQNEPSLAEEERLNSLDFIENNEKKPENHQENVNLEHEFKEINVQDEDFTNDKFFALMSHRNTRVYTGSFQQLLNPLSPSKPVCGKQENNNGGIMNNSSKMSKKKKKEENPDQIYIETMKFFIKHKYKFLFMCLLIPVLRYNFNHC